MTSTSLESPELESPRGHYGAAPTTYVRRLLNRATAAGVSDRLNADTVAKMRRHYQVSSCLLVQSLPLVRADWSIECDDEEQRERLTEAYRAIAFDVHRTMTKALPWGYSPNTLTWGYRDDVRLVCPIEVRDLEPRTCAAAVDDAGGFDGIVQNIAGTPDEAFDPIYCLWIVEGMESGNLYGRALLEAARDPWADYAALRAFHARYLERFGEPVVLARAPEGKRIQNGGEIQAAVAHNEANDLEPGDEGYVQPPDPILVDNLDAALEMGENLRHHSVVALPSSVVFGADGKPNGYAWQLDFKEATGGHGQDFLEAIRECDKRIARAMFVPDLLSQNGDGTGSGSYALGQTHKSVWSESVEGRLDDYSRQITDQVIEPIRRLNFGDSSAPARLVFSPLADEQRDRTWALVVSLVESGRLPVDGRALADEVGLPLTDGEPDPVTPPDPATAPPGAAGASSTYIPATLALDPVKGLPDWKLPQAYDPPAWRRALNPRERRVGFASIEGGMNAAEAAIVAQLTDVLDVEHDRVLRQLNAVIRKGSQAEILAALGTLEVKAGPKVSRAWSDLMADVGDLAVTQLRDELAAYAASLPDRVTPKARAMFQSYAATSAERAVTNLTTEVRLGLLNAYTSGVSRAGMASIVGQVFDAYVTSEGKPIRLTTRMLSAKSLNYSRADAVEAGGIPLAGAQYSAILDRRTCDLCRDQDELVIPIESTDLQRFTPPVHHNCRCVWVWITRDEADFTPTWTTPASSKVDRYGGLVF